jgi:hypothetical protein
MSFNKYVIAIGVALSFLMASLNADECPTDTPKYINKVDAECKKLWDDYNAMSAEEKEDTAENSKNVKITTAFAEKCDTSRHVVGAFPKCSTLTPAQCVNEPAKCKLVGEKCTTLTVAEQGKNQTPCAASIGAQGTYCGAYKTHTTSFAQCLCSKRGGCAFDCAKLTNEAACATEPTACNWNGSECIRVPA